MTPEDVRALRMMASLDFRELFVMRSKRERCGLVLPDGSLVELPNRHPNPRWHFRMVIPRSVQAWGIWHTHPKYQPRTPSPHDFEQLPEGLYGIVVQTGSRSLTLYTTDRVIGTRKHRR